MIHEATVPAWLSRARAKAGQQVTGPSGAKVIGYEHRWKWGRKYSSYEGGLVDAQVSDWDRAETCLTCSRKIVHVFWVRHPDGTTAPYGGDHLHTILGHPREMSRRDRDRIRNRVLNRSEVEREQRQDIERILQIADKLSVPMSAGVGAANLKFNRAMKRGPGPRAFFIHAGSSLLLAVDTERAQQYKDVLGPKGWEGPFKGSEVRARLSESIVEVLKSPFEWKWEVNPNSGTGQGFAEFRTKSDSTYVVVFYPSEHDNVCEVEFSACVNGRCSAQTITGTGEAFRILATVVAIVRDWIRHTGGRLGLTFTAREPSRRSLYARMTQRIGREIGWLHHADTEGGLARFWVIPPGFL